MPEVCPHVDPPRRAGQAEGPGGSARPFISRAQARVCIHRHACAGTRARARMHRHTHRRAHVHRRACTGTHTGEPLPAIPGHFWCLLPLTPRSVSHHSLFLDKASQNSSPGTHPVSLQGPPRASPPPGSPPLATLPFPSSSYIQGSSEKVSVSSLPQDAPLLPGAPVGA